MRTVEDRATPLASAWVTTFGAAKLLNCSPAYVRRLAQLSLLRKLKFDGRLFFHRVEVLQYAATHPRPGQSRQAS